MKKLPILLLSCILGALLPAIAFAQVIEGTFAIKNVETSMVLRIKDANGANGTQLVAYSPVNWKCVTWDFNHVAGQTYQLRNLFTNKTFQPANGVASEGVLLEQQPLVRSRDNQLYDFILVEKNVYLVKATGTDLYLTPFDKNGTTDTPIMLSAKNGSKLQQWIIYLQKPTM